MDFRTWFFAYFTPPEWSALAGVGTLVVAFAAAVFAAFQVRVASQSRRDRTRPYVAVYLEATHLTLYFVVKNFGSTTARNVKVTTDIPIRRSYKSGDDYEVFKLFEELPVMVPGQEWRTFLDASLPRFNNDDLKMETYEATATYRDSRGRKLTPDKFKLDWTTFHEMEFEQKADIGDLAKSLEKIKDVVDGWSERTGKGLAVFTRNGKAKDDQWTADLLARRQKLAEQQSEEAARLAAQPAEPANDPQQGD